MNAKALSLRWTPKTGPGNQVDFPWFNFGSEDRGQRKIRSGRFKAKVAIAALRDQDTLGQLPSRVTMNSPQITV
jgi:hypothetical protein